MADDVSGAATDQDRSYAEQAGDLMAGVGASLPRTDLGQLVQSTFASSLEVMRPSTNVEDDRTRLSDLPPDTSFEGRIYRKLGWDNVADSVALRDESEARFPLQGLSSGRNYRAENDPWEATDRLTRPLHTIMRDWGDNGNPLAAELGANSVRDAAARIAAAVRARQQADQAVVPIAAPYY